MAQGTVDFDVAGTVTITASSSDAADLSISKDDGVTTAVPGQTTLNYTIVARNDGPTIADRSVTVLDTFPAALSCTWSSVSANGASGSAGSGSGNLNESLSLPVNATVTYTVSCDIDPAATGTLSNTATISGSASLDSDTTNNTATDNNTVLNPTADISITKTDGQTTAVPGQNLSYTIVAANAGPSTDPSVSVMDTFPASLSCSYTSAADGSATGNTASGVGNLAETLSMPPGSSVTYTVSCNIDPAATGTLSNTATITASVTDPTPGNNANSDTDTALTPQADLSISKDDGVTTAVPGQTTLSYTIVAANAGPSSDPSVSVTDTFPADLTCTYTSVAAGGATGNTAGSGNLAETLS
ncbi:MAG: DUF11 domain-containing protein, partial [Gammaproteobacteria bacterium]|nr:DUF11 domain-containing protein [Gammaproteobacteria bacterium]